MLSLSAPGVGEDGPPAVGPTGAAIPGQYIVTLNPGVDAQQFGRELRGRGAEILQQYSHALTGFAYRGPKLDDDPRIASIEPDRIVRIASDFNLPTGVDRVQADRNSIAAIARDLGMVDVDVAILDTGIDPDHPDLNVVGGFNGTKGNPSKWKDDHGHGTHVAGTVGALDDGANATVDGQAVDVAGMAPGARLWSVKVLDSSGRGSDSEVIKGIDWVTQHADTIEVANMSLGRSGYSAAFHNAIQNSVAAGVVYVVAAGNSSRDVHGADGQFATDDDYFPASLPEVATISALSDSDGQPGGAGPPTYSGIDDSFADFTNFSASAVAHNPVASPGAAIDLAMPGAEILSTKLGGGYVENSGTSMAAPHAAGLAALYIAANGRDQDGDGDHDADDVYRVRQALIDGGVAQDAAGGLATLNDPDSNWEPIGWAYDAVGATPAVAWVAPQQDETVSGTASLRIDAGDAEDPAGTLTVEWRADGGAWQTAAYNAGTGYYEAAWDTTLAGDGARTLGARTIDSDGNQAVAFVAVVSENTDDAPLVGWFNPQDGATVDGAVPLRILAGDDRDAAGALTVEWRVDDGAWQSPTYNATSGYYEATWLATTVAGGEHTLESRAVDSGANTAVESVTVTVASDAVEGPFGFGTAFAMEGASEVNALAVDADNNVYIGGWASSQQVLAKYDAAATIQWVTSVDGLTEEFPSYTKDVAIGPGGDLYITGAYYGDVDFGGTLLTESDGGGFVARIDAVTGAFVWVAPFGGEESAYGDGVAVGSDGRVYVTGTFWDVAQFGGLTRLSSVAVWAARGPDILDGETFTVDDGAGVVTFEMERAAIGDGVAPGHIAIVVNGDESQSGVAALIAQAVEEHTSATGTQLSVWAHIGHAQSVTYTPLDPDDASLRVDIEPSAFLVELDGTDGTFLSVEGIPGRGLDAYGRGVAVHESPDETAVYVGGLGPEHQASRAFIWKRSSKDGSSWVQRIGGGANLFALAVDAQGNLLTTGYYYGSVDFDPGEGVDTRTSRRYQGDSTGDIFVWKLGPDGIHQWVAAIDGPGASYDSGYGIDVDADGNVYTTGRFVDKADFDPGKDRYELTANGEDYVISTFGWNYGTEDIFISKLDAGGNFAWATSVGGDAASWFGDVGRAIAVDAAGSVFVGGSFRGTADFDPTGGETILTSSGEGYESGFVLKLTQPTANPESAAATSPNDPATTGASSQDTSLAAQQAAYFLNYQQAADRVLTESPQEEETPARLPLWALDLIFASLVED